MQSLLAKFAPALLPLAVALLGPLQFYLTDGNLSSEEIWLLVGALAVVAAVLTADGTNVELLGLDVTALGLYLIGLGSGLAILWGFSISKWGTKRSLRQRRESKQLSELSEKLDRAEADRRGDDDHDKNTDRG